VNRRFLEVYLLQAFYCLPFSLGWAFALLFYVSLGFTATQIMVFYLVHYLTILSVLMLLRKSRAFSLITASLFLAAVGFFVISRVETAGEFYLVPVIFGLASPLFWIPYNIIYFSFAQKDGRALTSGLLFLVLPALNTVMPILAGLMIASQGFRVLFTASMLAAILALVYAIKVGDSKVLDLSYRKTLKPTKGVRTLIYLEGIWQGVSWICVPLITFTFIDSSLGYGSFLSYLGVIGAISSLILCGISDRLRNRTFFLVPAVTLVSVFTIASGLTHSLSGWVVVNGLVGFFIAVTSPFTVSVVLDRDKDIREGMISREFFLNFGRVTGVLTIMLLFHFYGSLHYPLIAAGIAFALYPVVLRAKNLYPSRISIRSIVSGIRRQPIRRTV